MGEDTELVPAGEAALATDGIEDEMQPSKSLQSGKEWNAQMSRWEVLFKTGLLPGHITDPSQALLIALMGDELGLRPMDSLRSLYVVDGKVEMAAELIHRKIRECHPDATIQVLKHDAKICRLKATRGNDESIEVQFTIEDAKRAKIAGKKNWMTYPEDMLWARCISRLRRRMFPDVCPGVGVPGEFGNLGPENKRRGAVEHVEPPQITVTQLGDDE